MYTVLMILRNVFWFFVILFSLHIGCCDQGTCNADGNTVSCRSMPANKLSHFITKRHILYEINPGEGFNLRRDVYMRIATLVKKMRETSLSDDWILVLPPWGPLYHWKSRNIGYQTQIKWAKFFDIPSLAKYVPVIEFEEFLDEHGPEIDIVFNLQHYAEGWTDGRWEEKADIRDCIDPSPYRKTEDNDFIGWFWGYENVFAKEFHCLSIQGYSSTLGKIIASLNAKAIMIDRAEVILHDSFGDAEYWKVRKSMIFSKELIAIGDSFRETYLNSTDKQDKSGENYDASKTKRSAIGGPYLSVHLRRLDFVISRSKEVPSLKHAADQILEKLQKLNLEMVFVATDASELGSLENVSQNFVFAC